ncbi:DUF342 domain-containing protein [Halodesulfovibrio sp.]|jgi:uncharacterized protein (DUF342 family)|uniref:DUF342 domain-containing protein n=1 Tax=Halodesulfovibrio sp. TaxID=1912772 RepID=UPI0025CDE182|nr:FapA family protein [Halodesulfovibrio sp.]MCT4536020.1 FapA family protein [Halodesulfovibrio sp.]
MMSINEPVLTEEESIFSRYIALAGNPLLPVTPGTCIGKALRLGHFHLSSEIGDEQENHILSHNYSIDFTTNKIYATSLGMLHIDNNKIVVRPILYPANDGMTVYADIYHKDFSGNSLLLSHYASALWQLNVNTPIDTARFTTAANKAVANGNPVRMVPICKGKPPIHEEQPAILPLLPERVLRTMQSPSDPINFKDRGFFAEVPAHTPVAVKVPAPEPSNGFDVYGNALPVMSPDDTENTTAEEKHLQIGKNLYGIMQHGGHTVYYSSCKGLLNVRNDILSITDVLHIDGDVNMKTGNVIVQRGSVHVTGSITAGFTVEAPQHVIVDGDIDQGSVSCGGDIFVSGAIIMNEASTITSKGSVYANHIHNADVVAAQNIITTGSIVNSELTAGKAIRTCTEKGTVLGSTLVAGSEINIAGAGGEHGTPPILIITNEAGAQRGVSTAAAETEEALTQSISKLDDWIKRSQEKELTGAMRQRADALLQKAKRIRKSIANKVTPQFTHPAHRVIIRGTVAAGTLVTMHGQTLTIEHPLPKLTMELENHKRAVKSQQATQS